MKERSTRQYNISRLAYALLILALVLSLTVPVSAASDTPAADSDTVTAQASEQDAAGSDAAAAQEAEEEAVTKDADPDAGKENAADPDSQTEKAAPAAAPVATSISGYNTLYNKRHDKSLIIEADISPADGREIQLQRYNTIENIWTTILTVTSEVSEGETASSHVSISVPEEERMMTNSKWRIYVPATDSAAEAYSDDITIITCNIENLNLSARASCIYKISPDGNGVMIYSRNSSTKVAQASTTKLMTSILLIDSGLLDSTTMISTHAASTPWGSGRLASGDVYNTRDLLYAMLLPSSNDAATAVAERVGGTEAAFVNMMNARAQEMGLTQTHFCNPHGLDADGHYTTALELAKLTESAYSYPEIRECWATQCKTIKSLKRGRRWTLWSTNAIFSYVKNFLGGKTGTEDNARCCFTGVYTYNGSTYVTVVLGSGYGFSRWSDTKKLHKYIQDYADTSY